MMRKTILALVLLPSLAACSDAQMASNNLSRAADMFEVTRRVVFFSRRIRPMTRRRLRRYWNRYRLHAVLLTGIVMGLGYFVKGMLG